MNEEETMAAAERAIWTQDYQRLAALPEVDARSWAGAAQQDLKRHGVDAPLGWPTQPQTAASQVAVVMLLKDEADIIHHNLRWLHFVGVRKFALCDNGSTDGSAQEIGRFRDAHPDAEVVVIFDPLIRYVQALKTTAMFRWALTMWPDVRWVFPIDADEFLVPTRGLGVLDTVPGEYQAISIPKVVHFRHRLGGEPKGGNPLSRMALRSRPFVVPPKSACRSELDLSITQGNHSIQSSAGRRVAFAGGFSLGLYYREFQTRDFDHFRRKVVNGGRAIRAAQQYVGGGVGGDHWLAWFDLLETGGDPALRGAYEVECVRDLSPHFVVDPFDTVPA